MNRLLYALGFALLLLPFFGIIRTRSEIVASGNKIITLQNELRELKDANEKLQSEYRRVATAETILQKNTELNLSLVPPQQVICLRNEDKEVASLKETDGTDTQKQ